MDKGKLNEEIARVAYSLFERRGRMHGYAEQDWLEAESIVIARHAERGVQAEPKKTAPRKRAAAPKEAKPRSAAKKPARKKTEKKTQ